MRRFMQVVLFITAFGVVWIVLLGNGIFPLAAIRHTHVLAVQLLSTNKSSASTDIAAASKETDIGGLHVVMLFPIMDSEKWKNGSYVGYGNDGLLKRQEEYVSSLRSNLQQSIVEKIHLLTDQPDLLRMKLSQEYKVDVDKTQVHNVSERPMYREIFQYASDFLQGKVVFIVNSDITIGEGFDQINMTWWTTTPDVMYALTRHALKNRPADCQKVLTGLCDPKGSNIGSHDGFLFHMRSPLPEAFLKELEFQSDAYGSENVIIWGFQKILKYTVTNPCRRLIIYHNHCSNIRPSDGHRVRVNSNGKSGSAGFSY